MELVQTTAFVGLTDCIAKVRIQSRYRNPSEHILHVIVPVQLPIGAYLTEVAYQIGDQPPVYGHMVPRRVRDVGVGDVTAQDSVTPFREGDIEGMWYVNLDGVPPGDVAAVTIEFVDRVMMEFEEAVVFYRLLPEVLQWSGSGGVIDITASVQTGKALMEVFSCTHRLGHHKVGPNEVAITTAIPLQQGGACPEGFHIAAKIAGRDVPTATLQRCDAGGFSYASCIWFQPVVDTLCPTHPTTHVVIMIDASSNTVGPARVALQNALQRGLQQLPPSTQFNVVIYGSVYRVAFEGLGVPSTPANLAIAVAFAMSELESDDFGGSNLGDALAFVLELHEGAGRRGGTRSEVASLSLSIVCVVTGQVPNAEDCIQLAWRYSDTCRMLLVGLAPHAPIGSLHRLAAVTHGRSTVVTTSQLVDGVENSVKVACGPCCGAHVRVEWRTSSSTTTTSDRVQQPLVLGPAIHPGMWHGELWCVVTLHSAPGPTECTLQAVGEDGTRYEWHCELPPTTPASPPTPRGSASRGHAGTLSGDTFHVLGTARLLLEFQLASPSSPLPAVSSVELATRLATAYHVPSCFTVIAPTHTKIPRGIPPDPPPTPGGQSSTGGGTSSGCPPNGPGGAEGPLPGVPEKKEDIYKILGVASTATSDEIRRAYKKLAVQWHPDKNTGDPAEAQRQFMEISRAYEILYDPERRAAYDAYGVTDPRVKVVFTSRSQTATSTTTTPASSTTNTPAPSPGTPSGIPGDTQSTFETPPPPTPPSGGSSAPSTPRTKNSLPPREPPPVQEIVVHRTKATRYTASVNLPQVAIGASGTMSVSRRRCCPKCSGTGSTRHAVAQSPCPKCKGRKKVLRILHAGQRTQKQVLPCDACGARGVIQEPYPARCRCGTGMLEETFDLEVPICPGVADNTHLRFIGLGSCCYMGCIPGDVIVNIHVTPSSDFVRRGADLHIDCPVSLRAAMCGASLEVPTVHTGKLVPMNAVLSGQPMIRDGGVVCRRGWGLPVPSRPWERGDLYVHCAVVMPQHLEPHIQKKLAELLPLLDRETPNAEMEDVDSVASVLDESMETCNGGTTTLGSTPSKMTDSSIASSPPRTPSRLDL